MSNYYQLTKNPETGEFERAEWLDDYFGKHNYGVRFLDGKVYDVRKAKIEVKQELDKLRGEE